MRVLKNDPTLVYSNRISKFTKLQNLFDLFTYRAAASNVKPAKYTHSEVVYFHLCWMKQHKTSTKLKHAKLCKLPLE